MIHTIPFAHFYTSEGRSEALFGFTLPFLPSASVTSPAMQLQLVKNLWSSGITALDMRFVANGTPNIMLYLLCRLRLPRHIDERGFQGFYAGITSRIEQLFGDCGYQLDPVTTEAALLQALTPFQPRALAEVRRREKQLVLHDAYTEYEVYATYAWEWALKKPLEFFELLARQRCTSVITISLKPTRLHDHEQRRLQHAISSDVRDKLAGSMQGHAISEQYQAFAQKLQQPYLLRITLASPDQPALTRLGQAILQQVQLAEIMPVLQFPQSSPEWRAAVHNFRFLGWMPWGNICDAADDCARLRNLVDAQGACMGFHLPVAPEPMSSKGQKVNVLLVFADPSSQGHRLRLGSEDRIIREAIQLSRYRDNISLSVRHAATIHDLRRALLDEEFQVVHIAGHGAREGLILETEVGQPYRVPQQALANLFRERNLQCVVLNACYSLAQGELISLGVPFTIAMEGPVDDDSAREFARGFYDAVGAGKTIDSAYQEGLLSADFVTSGMPFIAKLFKKA